MHKGLKCLISLPRSLSLCFFNYTCTHFLVIKEYTIAPLLQNNYVALFESKKQKSHLEQYLSVIEWNLTCHVKASRTLFVVVLFF